MEYGKAYLRKKYPKQYCIYMGTFTFSKSEMDFDTLADFSGWTIWVDDTDKEYITVCFSDEE
jgi:hypothetical protein